MRLETERLLLVPLGPQYLMSTHAYASDIDNTKHMVYLPNKDVDETREFLECAQAEWQKDNPEFYEFAILFDNAHIGAISIYKNEDGTGELGWILNKRYWGNGFIVEAAKEVMNFSIQKLNIKTFIAHCDSENISSDKVMEKLGMSLIDRTQGRRNRSSNEDREELLYSLSI